MGKEKRKFKRLIFNPEDGIEGKFTFPGMNGNFIYADILNLSPAGAGLNFKSNTPLDINTSDYVMLKKINGIDDLKAISDIKVEIKWSVAYHPSLGTIAGCEFITLNKSTKKQIQQFVDSWFTQKPEELHRVKLEDLNI